MGSGLRPAMVGVLQSLLPISAARSAPVPAGGLLRVHTQDEERVDRDQDRVPGRRALYGGRLESLEKVIGSRVG